MERPSEIVWFERIYLGTLALGIVQSSIAWPEMVKMTSPLFILTTQLFVVGLIGGLVGLTSRRRSNVAKWILIAMFVVGLPLFVKNWFDGQLEAGSSIISVIQVVGQLSAMGLLFTPVARSWFKQESKVEANTP